MSRLDTVEELLGAEPLQPARGPRVRRLDIDKDVATVPYDQRLVTALRHAAAALANGNMRNTAALMRAAADELEGAR